MSVAIHFKPFWLMGYVPQIARHPFGLSPSKPGLAACMQGFDKPVLSLPKGSARTGGEEKASA